MTELPVPDDLADRLMALLDDLGVSRNRDLLFDILQTVTLLARDEPDRLDLKITRAALAEMREAFRVFAPYKHIPKVTMFGSARTLPEDPLYVQARELARSLATKGWMVVTGAGPGIMAAGVEGAGREMSFGVNIRLPFEQSANEFIAEDPKLVEMKYFFTRKLILMKESDGFVVLPGGFGTLDEAYELLTLVQTGKADPAPIVLLETPSGTYWHAWERFLKEQVAGTGLISPEDCHLYKITDDVEAAAKEMIGFYRNYHSRRFVGTLMVIRLKAAPTDEEIEQLAEEFADISVSGRLHRVEPLPPEVSGKDHLDLPRIALRFDRMQHGRLRQLINALNSLPSAPPERTGDVDRETAAGGVPPDAE